MIDFPAAPTVGQIFNAAGSTWEWDGVKWTSVASSGSGYLPLTGGTLTGSLTLAGNAAAALQAVPLQQLTSVAADHLPLTGGTLTGALIGTTATFSGSVNVAGDINTDMDVGVSGLIEVSQGIEVSNGIKYMDFYGQSIAFGHDGVGLAVSINGIDIGYVQIRATPLAAELDALKAEIAALRAQIGLLPTQEPPTTLPA